MTSILTAASIVLGGVAFATGNELYMLAAIACGFVACISLPLYYEEKRND